MFYCADIILVVHLLQHTHTHTLLHWHKFCPSLNYNESPDKAVWVGWRGALTAFDAAVIRGGNQPPNARFGVQRSHIAKGRWQRNSFLNHVVDLSVCWFSLIEHDSTQQPNHIQPAQLLKLATTFLTTWTTAWWFNQEWKECRSINANAITNHCFWSLISRLRRWSQTKVLSCYALWSRHWRWNGITKVRLWELADPPWSTFKWAIGKLYKECWVIRTALLMRLIVRQTFETLKTSKNRWTGNPIEKLALG